MDDGAWERKGVKCVMGMRLEGAVGDGGKAG